MAEIYLRHPEHGSKVAHLDLEATYDESNGWKRYIPFVADEEEIGGEEEIIETPIINAFERKRRR
jgi:hypothetical protein